MKKIVTGFLAASALAAPAFADERIASAQGLWTFDFANEKVCRAIEVDTGAFTIGGVTYATKVRVVNTDKTSESIYLLPATFSNSSEAIYKALLQACDHADENAKGDFHQKSYLINVTANGAAGVLPAVFGGVVGNLPTTGDSNAGTNGFIISVKVKTNN